MKEVYEEEKKAPQTEGERMAAKVDELNKEVEPEDAVGGNIDASAITPVEETNSAPVYQDKAEVISALKDKGISFDARGSKATLEKLLTQTEAE
jgi:predicted transcriptional regulator YheO